jgi:hypothetical protein
MWNSFKINRIDAANTNHRNNTKHTIMHLYCISVSYDPNHKYTSCIKTRDRSNKEKVTPHPQRGFILNNYIWVAFKKYYLSSLTSRRQVTYKQFQICLDTEDILTFT